jgi:hypothetical protein
MMCRSLPSAEHTNIGSVDPPALVRVVIASFKSVPYDPQRLDPPIARSVIPGAKIPQIAPPRPRNTLRWGEPTLILERWVP